jgi:hypothetical protein
LCAARAAWVREPEKGDDDMYIGIGALVIIVILLLLLL